MSYATARSALPRCAARVALLGLLSLATACAGPNRHAAGSRRPPNLVVILADDLGVETLGCYGGESHATPHLDALAAEGVRLENAFTQPLCTPTRVELLTGRSNARNYRAFSVLDPDERSFAEDLRDHGYATCVVGKWQLYGADHYGDEVRGQGSLPADAGFDSHALWQVETLGSRHWAPTLTVDGVTTTWADEHYGPDLALDHALRWIDAREPDEPWLLFWPTILPHDPFLAPPGHDGPRQPPGEPAWFGAMVEHLDGQVGRLVEHLRARGLAQDTVLLFVGDNGSPRQTTSVRAGVAVPGGKARTGATGTHVPGLLWAPRRLDAGLVLDDPVCTRDVLPTLLELAGVPLSEDRVLDGHSLMPRLRGEVARHREAVAFHHQPRPLTRPDSGAQRWARDARWQLSQDGELFDLAHDPTLARPLDREAESDEARAARARLRRALDELPWPDAR